ncbi:ABC transporter permease [Paenibacillus aquistagni]|uniref:ABC transporter permease n=1 Tax=Paenibacillus aquistagni TaxID=1852522 RepID=UPI00145A6FE7|nr:ABC transporter permease [Paenibacillus aquistagni]NMM54710.1 ABC transporter permease [Paenibacillus aquistagni]
MTFRQFAFNNVIRNKRIYVAHFLSSAFSVMVFFVYALLLFHPDLQGELQSTSETMSKLAKMGMNISQYLIFIFSFFFCMYSVSAFLKTRKREFGILMVHGMSTKQLHRLVFVENLMIGLAAIAAGILTGLVFAKLILLISAKVLYIQNGLPFYLPWKAVAVTMLAYAVMFFLVSLFTSRTVKVTELVELIRSEEKPKPEPKASLGLSVLGLVLILAGYGTVFFFVLQRAFVLPLLVAGVGLTVLGTYFLFTQLSVYAIRWMRGKESLFLKKTNLLTISELAYRMRDNATMFFMTAIISAVAFTGIGTCVAIADPGLVEMETPYAYSYYSTSNNDKESQHIKIIQDRLTEAGFAYNMAYYVREFMDDGGMLIKLSDYNALAKALGKEIENSLEAGKVMLVPVNYHERQIWQEEANRPSQVELSINGTAKTLSVQKASSLMLFPDMYKVYVVNDAMYDQIASTQEEGVSTTKMFRFVVPNWEKSIVVTNQILKEVPENDSEGTYYFSSLVTYWLVSKQQNGILFILSSLVGIVFFTFAASFLYFRLYTDLNRDQQQFQLISKVGLTRKELKRIVSQQLRLMFFLPMVVAVIHSSVAFIALQQLVDYSVLLGSLIVIGAFLLIQVLYYSIVRSRYTKRLLVHFM